VPPQPSPWGGGGAFPGGRMLLRPRAWRVPLPGTTTERTGAVPPLRVHICESRLPPGRRCVACPPGRWKVEDDLQGASRSFPAPARHVPRYSRRTVPPDLDRICFGRPAGAGPCCPSVARPTEQHGPVAHRERSRRPVPNPSACAQLRARLKTGSCGGIVVGLRLPFFE